MSYDIYLYEKRFLQRALDEDLGDWRNADPISDDKLGLIRERLKSKGYMTQDESEFEFPNSKWGLQVSVFKGEVAPTRNALRHQNLATPSGVNLQLFRPQAPAGGCRS